MKTAMCIVMVLVIAALSMPSTSMACPCNCKVLQACYKSCHDSFDGGPLTALCDGGCLIACVTSGQT